MKRPITAEDMQSLLAMERERGPTPIYDATVAHGLELNGASRETIIAIFGYYPDAETILGKLPGPRAAPTAPR